MDQIAIAHMISGKAVSRALCGHFLVEVALVNKLMLPIFSCEQEKANHNLVEHTEGEDGNDHETPGESPTTEIDTSISLEHKLDAVEVQKIHDLYEGIQDKSPVSDIAESKELIKLEKCLLKYKAFLAEKSRTSAANYGCSILSSRNFEAIHSS